MKGSTQSSLILPLPQVQQETGKGLVCQGQVGAQEPE